MSRRTRFPTVVLAVLTAAALAATLVATSSGSPGDGAATSAKRGGFKPGKIAGKWTGQWRNTTFGSKGSIRANVRVKPGRKLSVLADFGGNVFGCPDPPAAPATLRRGGGKNGWNAAGFRISKKTRAFGKLNLVYRFKDRSLKGSGSAPPCNPTITYKINGKLTPSRLKATVKIDLGGQTATSKLTAKKR
jgi:hypothetical protein